MSDRSKEIKKWYDGFTFGRCADIYNPWSIIHYLDKKSVGTYWANTSSNNLAGKLVRESGSHIKVLLASRYLKVKHLEMSELEQIERRKYGFAFCGKEILIGRK